MTARSQPTRRCPTTRPSQVAGPRSARAAVRIALGDRAVGAGPRLLDLRGPGRPGELRDGAEQRGADRVVVLGEHAELAVVAAELLEERHELVRAVHHLHDVHQRAQQAAALHLHVHREQVAGRGSLAEQRRVEVPRDLLRAGGDDREAGADERDGDRPAWPAGAPRGPAREQLLRGHRASAPVLAGAVRADPGRRCNRHGQIRSTRSGVRRGWARRRSRVACASGRTGSSGPGVCETLTRLILSVTRSRPTRGGLA